MPHEHIAISKKRTFMTCQFRKTKYCYFFRDFILGVNAMLSGTPRGSKYCIEKLGDK